MDLTSRSSHAPASALIILLGQKGVACLSSNNSVIPKWETRIPHKPQQLSTLPSQHSVTESSSLRGLRVVRKTRDEGGGLKFLVSVVVPPRRELKVTLISLTQPSIAALSGVWVSVSASATLAITEDVERVDHSGKKAEEKEKIN
ncbi:hypothetical protein BGX38DRAFT_1331206 [Terfezia claveryi]|nr:hypothetical protein BGX38DRAFT_1331206 [Terfezia claveryi]